MPLSKASFLVKLPDLRIAGKRLTWFCKCILLFNTNQIKNAFYRIFLRLIDET